MTFSKKILACCVAMPLAFGVLSAQNVGIGEVNPASKLSVKGNSSIGEDYSNVQAPDNGAIIQGQTVVGKTEPFNPEDVFTVYAPEGGFAVNGFVDDGIRSTAGTTARLNTAALYGFVQGEGGIGLLVDHIAEYDFGGVINTYSTKVTAALKADTEADTAHAVFGEVPNGSYGFAIYGNGDINATGGYFSLSDANLKMNISDYHNGLSTIMALKPKSYLFKPELAKKYNFHSTDQIGFLAQELEEVMPTLVRESRLISLSTTSRDAKENIAPEEMQAKAVNYIGLIPVITAAIQEQQGQIETLKKENEVMKAQLEFLMQEVQELKKSK